MKILVTGGAGFIGSHLIDALLGRGDEVVCLDNFDPFYDPAIKRKNIAPFLKHPQFAMIEGDIRDRNTLLSVFQLHQITHIVHLAAKAGVRPSLLDPVAYEQVNVQGTLNLLDIAKDKNIEAFVFASSSSVYGQTNKVPFSEDEILLYPISPYGATKLAGEAICRVYHHLYQLKVSMLRFFTVYGPRQRPEMAIHKFIDAIYHQKEITLYGDGSSKRDYTFISDTIQGVLGALDEACDFEVFNLGESQMISLIDLVHKIEKILDKKAKIKFLPDQPGDVPLTCSDNHKAKNCIGYRPCVSIDEGLQLFVKWYINKSSGN